MALSPCNTTTDISQRELVTHGTHFFPIACYQDDLYADGVMWHWHDEFEYAIALPGSSTFLIENTQVFLRQGDGIFIGSQVMHAVEHAHTPGTGLHSAVFHPRLIGSQDSTFWESYVQPLWQGSGLRYVVLQPEIPWQRNMLAHLHSAWNAMEAEPEDYQNEIRYHLTAALGILVRHSEIAARPLSRQEQLDIARVRGMLDYIHSNFPYDMTMEEIAKSVSSSNSVCLRCFHQVLGTTPIQYLKNYRLEKAAQMLKTTGKTAKDIALDCGFNDISYFTKSFREKLGCTPKEFQRKAKHTP